MPVSAGFHSTVTLRDVYSARKRTRPYVRHTPLQYSPWISQAVGADVYLKLETEQLTRAFKVRGAVNRLMLLSDEEREHGVVTVSTGNHGKAVATIAAQLGIRAVVCVPELVLAHKKAAIEALGAEVVVRGKDQEEAEDYAVDLAERERLTYVSPFDDPAIIAGQGTIGLEILEDLPEADQVVVPLSGGGLMSGIATVMKSVDPRIRTTGVSMDRSPVMYWSILAGRPIQMPETSTLADSLMGGIGLENQYTFDIIRTFVDETVLVSEEEIGSTMARMLIEERMVVEGGGAVGLAALLAGKIEPVGDSVVVVVSGGNADMNVLLELVAKFKD